MSAPIEYRLADLEGVSVTNPAALTFNAFQVNPPTWPADKRVTWKEAFHFAFCAKRIGVLFVVPLFCVIQMHPLNIIVIPF